MKDVFLLFRDAFIAAVLFSMAGGAPRAQNPQGPITPPPKIEIRRLPTAPEPPEPPLPPEQIIRRMAESENLIQKAYNTYTFTQTIRLQELVEDGGEFTVTGEQYARPDGQRFERIITPPQSSLKRTVFSLEDVKVITSLPLFFLTTSEVPKYDLKYQGKEQLDQVSTFVFGVKPKTFERNRRYFQGVIWVDDQDFAVVKSSGQFVTEVEAEAAGEKFPFRMYDIYRENIMGKLWFPTYITSEDYVREAGGSELHLRLVARSTDFKPASSAAVPQSAKPTP